MKHCGTKTLETDRLILRRAKASDATPMLANWAGDPEVTRYLSWEPHRTIKETREVIRLWMNSYDFDDFYHWMIEIREGRILIGTIGAVRVLDSIRMVHLGYCIGRPWWHHGYTSEALARLIRFFFEEVEVNRIESCHEPANLHSGAVMKKCGMRYEGTLRQAIPKAGGSFADACYHSILAEDHWKNADMTPQRS